MGIILVLFFAMFTRSLPTLCENSTPQTTPVAPIMSETWETVVPEAAPRQSTRLPGPIPIQAMPPATEAAILERQGFQTRYSTFQPLTSTLMRFSLQTDSPGTRFLVTRHYWAPRATQMPGRRCCWTNTLGAPLPLGGPFWNPPPLGLPPKPPRPPCPPRVFPAPLSQLLNLPIYNDNKNGPDKDPFAISMKYYFTSIIKSRGQSLISLSNLTRMKSNCQLTRNAILYISLGFTQPSVLQVLSLRKGCNHSLQMVVYDGIVYIGAHYDYSAPLKRARNARKGQQLGGGQQGEEEADGDQLKLPARLDVVRVQALLHTKNQPLSIVDLEILQTGLFDILGREIITLQDYMKRRRFLPMVEVEEEEKDDQSSKPSKHVKESEEGNGQIQEPIANTIYLAPEQESLVIEQMANNQSFANREEHEGSYNQQNQHCNQNLGEPRIMAESRIQEQQSEGFLAFQSKQAASQNLNWNQQMDNQKSISNANQSHELQPHSQLVSQPERPKVQSLIQNKLAVSRIEVLLSEQEDSVQIVETQSKPKRSTARQVDLTQIPKPHHCKKENTQSDCMLIKDLYERMHRFRIICRVNYIENFMSQKGNNCVKMMLIDQSGDEIFCILYDKAAERKINGTLNILKGRTYIFENGDVEKDDSGVLSISMPWSGIHQTKLLMQSFHPLKMFRVGQLEGLSSDYFMEKIVNTNSSNSINIKKGVGKQLNVCGIFIGLREQPKLLNNQFKVLGCLCDYDQERSINFSLFVTELTSFPRQQGVVLSLHNMRVVQNQGTYRLQSTKRSYYLVQNHNEHRYMADLVELSKNQQWKMHEYKNLSEIVYVGRKIREVQELLMKLLEGDHCYSEIDCNVASITETKQYQACVTCKKNVKHSTGVAAYCYFCKRVERWVKRYLFIAEVADSTSSIEVKFSSDEIQGFVNMTVQNYAKMTPQSRHSVLELCTYQNLLLRVKSEKAIGGSLHYVTKVQRVSHARSLQEIKEKAVEDKTRYTLQW